MVTGIKFDEILDAKGLTCPAPVLKTKKAISALSKDQILKVETTDPGSRNDLAAWAKRTGNELIRTEEDSGTFRIFIRKTS